VKHLVVAEHGGKRVRALGRIDQRSNAVDQASERQHGDRHHAQVAQELGGRDDHDPADRDVGGRRQPAGRIDPQQLEHRSG
jgi:hypothetical protein